MMFHGKLSGRFIVLFITPSKANLPRGACASTGIQVLYIRSDKNKKGVGVYSDSLFFY